MHLVVCAFGHAHGIMLINGHGVNGKYYSFVNYIMERNFKKNAWSHFRNIFYYNYWPSKQGYGHHIYWFIYNISHDLVKTGFLGNCSANLHKCDTDTWRKFKNRFIKIIDLQNMGTDTICVSLI